MPLMPSSQSPMIAPQAKPHNDSRSLIFRWSPLHTLITGKCVDEHDRVIQQLYCLLLDCGRRSNLHNNGRLRGIVDALSIRRHALTEFIETHRRMYGRLDADRIEEFVLLVDRLDQALATAKKVHMKSISTLQERGGEDSPDGKRLHKFPSSAKRETSMQEGVSVSSKPSTPRAGAARGQHTPRRSPLDSKQGSTVPLLRANDLHSGNSSSSPLGFKSAHGVVIPPIRGISAAGEDTFLRFVTPVVRDGSPSATARKGDGEGSDLDNEDAINAFGRQSNPRHVSSMSRLSQSPRRQAGALGAAIDAMDRKGESLVSTSRTPRPIGALFDAPPTARTNSRHSDSTGIHGQFSAKGDPTVSGRGSGQQLGLLFTNPLLEVENFIRVENLARQHEVEDAESLAWAGLTTWFEQEWHHLAVQHEKSLQAQRIQLLMLQQQVQQHHEQQLQRQQAQQRQEVHAAQQQQQQLFASPPHSSQENASFHDIASTSIRSTAPQRENPPPPLPLDSGARPLSKEVKPNNAVETAAENSTAKTAAHCDAVMEAHARHVQQRQNFQQKFMGFTYFVLILALGVGLLLLDDVLDQYRPAL